MIRINLLGKPKSKTKRSSAAAAMEFETGGSPNSINVLAAIVVLAITGGSMWWYQSQLSNEAASIKTRMDAAMQEAQRLAETKARYEQRQKVKQEYEARVKVIDSLRAAQTGPVDLMTMVSATVNRTDEVWLNQMNDLGPSVDVNGVALSTDAVANLMTNLMKTGYFKAVEIRETFQDEGEKKILMFNFTLNCEKLPTGAAATAKKS
jgi:Tfp pilus assembly protein PilN